MSTVNRVARGLMAERALPKLATRTVLDLHNFHIAQTSKGVFCLDFNRWFPTLDDFNRWVVPQLKSMNSEEICPAAPEPMWREFMDETRFTFANTYVLPIEVAQFRSRGLRRVTIVQGEFS